MSEHDDWLMDDDLCEVLGGQTPPDLSLAILGAARLRGYKPSSPPGRGVEGAPGRPYVRAVSWRRITAGVGVLAVVALVSGALGWRLASDRPAPPDTASRGKPAPATDNPDRISWAGVRVRGFDELAALPADVTAIEYMPDLEYYIGATGERVPRIFTIQGEFAEQFSRFEKLESLRLENCTLSPVVWRAVGGLGGLRALTLHCSANDADLATLAPLQQLERLDLADNKGISDDALPHIAALKSLRSLNLSGCGQIGRYADAAALASLERLEKLDLSGTSAGRAEFLAPLAQLASLRRLSLNDAGADDAAMEVVATFSAPLESLEVGGNVEITAGGVAAIARVSSLRQLSLRGLAGVSNSTMYALRPLVNLIELDLTNCQNIQAESLIELGYKDSLQVLRLAGCDVTDAVASRLADLPLVELDLTFTRITDEGVRRLASCKELRRLSLGSCAMLTGDALTYAGELPSLQALDLEGSRYIPESAVVAFRRAHPRAAIVPPR